MEYVEHMSLWMDIKCIYLTIVTVLKKDSAEISEQGIKGEIEELKHQEEYTRVV